MVYTNATSMFWVNHMADTTWFADNGYRLWIRHLDVQSPTLPASNWGGHGWTIWQYAVVGGLDGISGKVDRDWFNGTSLAPIKIKNNR
jgi:GH25 family lysozyme M1 (1,4-beta-N-acetylmuramidase)